MRNTRRAIAVVILVCLATFLVPRGQAAAGSLADATNKSNLYNDKVAPIANYNADQVNPYNLFFANRTESVAPGSGALAVTETDLVLPGRNGLDLKLQRLYQSPQANVYRAGTAVESTTYEYWIPGYWATRTIKEPDTTTCTSGCTMVPKQRWIPPSTEEVLDTGCKCWKTITRPGGWETYYEEVCTITCTTIPGSIRTEEYWVPGKWEYDFDYYVVNRRTTDTWVDRRNGLGVGWQWDLPALEIAGKELIYHNGGSSLVVDMKSASRFKDYPVLDVIFDNDAGSFSNGQTTSKYKVTTKDGQITYFGSDGRLLGIRDRYGNQIKFEHTTFNGQPVISKITDTVGRVVTLTYSASQVTVTAPGGRVWRYGLTGTEGGKVLLSSVKDPEGRLSTYTYNIAPAAFSFLSKSNRNTTNYYANLTQVTYPTGGSTSYTYAKTIDNLGSEGTRELYKVTSRKDTVNGLTMKAVTYSSTGEPGGYPTHSNPANLPTTYTYSGAMTSADGTKTTVTFNHRHQVIKTEILGAGYRTLTEISYDSNKQPTQTKVTYYNQSGATRVITTATTYDNRGNLVSSTNPLGAVTTYTYDPKFSQLTSMQMVRSDGTTLRTEYTVNATNGNREAEKRVVMDNGTDRSIRTEYSYDVYGNRTQSRLIMGDGTTRVKSFEYGPSFGSAYLTRETESYAAADGTLKQVSQVYGYDYHTGYLTSYIDPMGAVTTVTYDLLGRPLSLAHPSVDGLVAQRTFAYDDASVVTRATDEAGRVTTYHYDQLGLLRQVRRTLNGTEHTVQNITYDQRGNRASETDANGNTTSFTYDGGQRLTKITHADLSEVIIEYDDTANKQTVTDQNGNKVVSYYNALGQVVEVHTKPDRGGQTLYVTTATYDNVGNLVATQDARGNLTRLIYDGLNRLIRQVDALGNETSWTYNHAGEKIAEMGPEGRTTAFSYDPAGRLITVTDALGGITSHTYDAKGRLLSQTDARGSTTRYEYDARDRLLREVDALGHITDYTFDVVGNRTSATDARGHTTTYTYDEWNRLVGVTDPLGAVTAYGYDLQGNQTSVTNPLGYATTFAYDSRNRLVRETNALGVPTARYAYDGVGNRISQTDAKGGLTSFVYDGVNRLIKVINPLGVEAALEYDAMGNLTRSVDGNGHATSYQYDALNRLTSATDALGATWQYSLNAYGQVTKVTDPLGRLAREDTFDGLGRRITSTDPLGTVTVSSYDPIGNLVGVATDNLLPYPNWTLSSRSGVEGVANGWQKVHRSDADDTASVLYAIEDSAQKVSIGNHQPGPDGTLQEYGAGVQHSSRIPVSPGEVVTLSVDVRQAGGGFIQIEVDFLDQSGQILDGDLSPAYEATSDWTRLEWTPKVAPANAKQVSLTIMYRTDATDPNGSAWFRLIQAERGTSAIGPRFMSYDPLNRMVRMVAAGNITVDLAYDAVGNRTSMTDTLGTTTYTYDALNRLLTRTVPDGKSISYSYDLAGQRYQVKDYAGKVTEYSWDQVGRLIGAQYSDEATATFEYDQNGNRVRLSLSDGPRTSYAYDAANRVTSITHTTEAGTVLSDYGYAYDNANQVITKTDERGQTHYTYDDASRLTTEISPTGETTYYGYDPVGNRTAMITRDGTTYYTYNPANQLLQEITNGGTKNYSWDKSGNQLGDGTAQYAYDSLNRLSRVVVAGTQVSYAYDGDGMMITRYSGSETTRFYLDGVHAINEGNGAGIVTASMFRGAGTNIGRKVGSEPITYYLNDNHGDVVGVTAHGTDELVSTYDYDAFGVLTGRTGSLYNPYLYAGEYYDFTIQQYYLRARFYSPRLGRFITRDTYEGSAWQPWTQNLYSYVYNNPVNFVDPTGHAGRPLLDAGPGGAVGPVLEAAERAGLIPSAEAVAADLIAARGLLVSLDIEARFTQVQDFFVSYGHGSDCTYANPYGCGRAVVDFMRWEIDSKRLGFSAWWNAVNAFMVQDMLVAKLAYENGLSTTGTYTGNLWLEFMRDPSPGTFWDAHTGSLESAVDHHVSERFLKWEAAGEQDFIRYVVIPAAVHVGPTASEMGPIRILVKDWVLDPRWVSDPSSDGVQWWVQNVYTKYPYRGMQMR